MTDIIVGIVALILMGAFCVASCWLVYLEDKEKKTKEKEILNGIGIPKE